MITNKKENTTNNTLQLFDNTHINEMTMKIKFDTDFSLIPKNYSSIKLENETNYIQTETSIKEIYKDIPEYKGHYQVSNKGSIKSFKNKKEKILSPSIDDKNGYYRINLYKDKKRKSYYIHQLVAIAFLNHKPDGNKIVIDHIDNDKTNNKLENIQVLSNRENLSKDKWRSNPSSLYTGVCFHKTKKKWESSISVKGDSFHLGYFSNEISASLEYQQALNYINKHSDLTSYPFKTKRRVNISITDFNQLSINFIFTDK